MIFQCNRCLKFFDKKSNYLQHLARKIQCNLINNIILDHGIINKNEEVSNTTFRLLDVVSNTTSSSQKLVSIPIQINVFINSKENGYKCIICNIIYKHSQTLTNHKKSKHPNYETDIINIISKQKEENTLKQVKDSIIEQSKQIEYLNEKNKQLELLVKTSKSKISKSKTKNNGQIINNGQINNGQIINNNFNIVSFGDEDINKLTKEEILSILKSRSSAFINLVKMVHLNDRLPEYHNVLINNLKSKYGFVMDDNKLVIRKKDKIIADIISNRVYDLNSLVEQYKQTKQLTKIELIFLDEMILFCKNYYLEDEDFDGNIIKPNKDILRKNQNMYDEVKCAFYNNRALIDNTLKRV